MLGGNNNNNVHTHHGALDGAAVGAFAGHEGHHGHTGRDALVGAGAGHLAENHHEKHGRTHAQNAGLTGGLAAGSPGTTTTTTSTTVPRASVGDKISGKVDVLVGKATNNPAKVALGEVKQSEGKVGLEQRGLAGANTAGGVGTTGSTGTGRGVGY